MSEQTESLPGCKPCRTREYEIDKIDTNCLRCTKRFMATLPPFDIPNDDYLKIVREKDNEDKESK